MIKFSNWEWVKIFLIFTIITGVIIMKNYDTYGSKGEFNVNEFEMGSESNHVMVDNNQNKIIFSGILYFIF